MKRPCYHTKQQWCAHWPLSWFTWIHQNSCRFDSIQLIMMSFQKGFNSPMITYTGIRFNSIQSNKRQDSTHLWCVQLSRVLLVISYVFAGVSAKIPYISDTWEYWSKDLRIKRVRLLWVLYNRHRNAKLACWSFFYYVWEYPCASPWLKNDGL